MEQFSNHMKAYRLDEASLSLFSRSRHLLSLGGCVKAGAPLLRTWAQAVGGARIAADSGLFHLEALHLAPTCWIGDFDSTFSVIDQIDESALSDFMKRKSLAEAQVKRFPIQKAMTDGEEGFKLLEEEILGQRLSQGPELHLILGGLGPGRLDHVLSHMKLLMACQMRLIENQSPDLLILTDGEQLLIPLCAPFRLSLDPLALPLGERGRAIVSFLVEENLENFSCRGLMYEVASRDFSKLQTELLSNEWRLSVADSIDTSISPASRICAGRPLHLDEGEKCLDARVEIQADKGTCFLLWNVSDPQCSR